MARKILKGLAVLICIGALGPLAIQMIGGPAGPSSTSEAEADDAGPPAEAIEAAKSAIRAEPKVKDFTYQPGQAVEWHVGVLDDGSPRHGYASYICQVLAEHGASTARTHVRVVDIVKVSQGENFRSASLGHVACSDFRVIVP